MAIHIIITTATRLAIIIIINFPSIGIAFWVYWLSAFVAALNQTISYWLIPKLDAIPNSFPRGTFPNCLDCESLAPFQSETKRDSLN